jgi:hypothetical protein
MLCIQYLCVYLFGFSGCQVHSLREVASDCRRVTAVVHRVIDAAVHLYAGDLHSVHAYSGHT